MVLLARTTRATLVAITVAALVFGIAMLAHSAEQSDTGIVQVALDESDPQRTRVGDLVYMGGIDIPPMGQNIGGLSGLRWDAESGRLLAITDDARWIWMTPTELNERLVGLGEIEVGPLLGLDGEPLTGKEEGDSESLTRSAKGGWLISFERMHRVWHYSDLTAKPVTTQIDPIALLGPLANNNGVEAMASSADLLVLCAERGWAADKPNCLIKDWSTGDLTGLYASAVAAVEVLGANPTDADIGSDGAIYVLFRSYSPQDGNAASIVSYRSDISIRQGRMALLPPLTVDNFEGLAVREEDGRTFLYIVSDDNFSSSQRTLLMKFEVLPEK